MTGSLSLKKRENRSKMHWNLFIFTRGNVSCVFSSHPPLRTYSETSLKPLQSRAKTQFPNKYLTTCFQALNHCFLDWTKPSNTSFILGTATDLARSTSELVAENALLRQQLIILRRQVKRPACTKTDRLILVLLVRASRAWKQALFINQEDDAAVLASTGMRGYYRTTISQSDPRRRPHSSTLSQRRVDCTYLFGKPPPAES